jgi:hypothetical protein
MPKEIERSNEIDEISGSKRRFPMVREPREIQTALSLNCPVLKPE